MTWPKFDTLFMTVATGPEDTYERLLLTLFFHNDEIVASAKKHT